MNQKKLLPLIVLFFTSCFFLPADTLAAGLHKPGSPATGDDFATMPSKTFEERRIQYLQFCADNANGAGLTGIFSLVARQELGLPVLEDDVRTAIALVYENRDCNDFTVGGLLRMLYLNDKKPQLSEKLKQDIEQCLVDFKYWWDEPVKDTNYRCYHTENHQGLYHSNELLAGQILKDRRFKDGKKGEQHLAHASLLSKRWLDFRVRFGFSEWLSPTYYDVDLMLLANLYDFAQDKAIRSRAGLLIDVILYEMALNNFKGVFGASTGRAYAKSIKGGRHQPTSSITKLVFGVGTFNSFNSMGAVALATSSYRCPEVIRDIATDYSVTLRNRQRQSMNVEDAGSFGLSYNSELDCHLFWGMQEFIHPMVINMSQQISEKYDTWPYRNYDHYKRLYAKQKDEHGEIVDSHLDRFALSEANVETYRTPHYMLSSVQDYRKGAPGYQQHIWQATLGVDAVVFTNHPGSMEEKVSPNFRAGNAFMPRAAQFRNVLVCVYNAPAGDKRPFSHAYFPKDGFDEVLSKGNWTFGRKADGYVALFSKRRAEWERDAEGAETGLRASDPQNIWICEMGSKDEWKSFERFIEAVSLAEVECTALEVLYQSPSLGAVKFGWSTPFSVNGAEHRQDKYPRFDNPYSLTAFDSDEIIIKRNGTKLVLDFKKGKRQGNSSDR